MIFLLIFAFKNINKKLLIKGLTVFSLIIMPLILYVGFSLILPSLGERYAGYKIGTGKITLLSFDKLPILLASIIFYYLFKKDNSNIWVYNIIYGIANVIAIYMIWFPVGRIVWYCNYAICIILPSIVKDLKETKFAKFEKCAIVLIICYAIIYSYRIVFVGNIGQCMLSYGNILFNW